MLGKILLLILFITSTIGGVFAQQNDFGMWNSFSFSKNISKDLKCSYTNEWRWQENISEANNIINDIGLSYKLNKNWRLGFVARYFFKRQLNNSFENRTRLFYDVKYTKKINKKQNLNLRLRYQMQNNKLNFKDFNFNIAHSVRAQCQYELKINKKWTTGLAYELFYNLPKFVLSNHRATVMFDYDFNKHLTLNLGMNYQKDQNKVNPYQYLNLLLGASYSFN